MPGPLKTFALTLFCLLLMDLVVAVFLGHLAPAELVRLFDYGRSVPGKQAEWQARPDQAGNLRNVAWRDAMMRQSASEFAAEPPGQGPVIRGYGMSFLNRILRATQEAQPGLVLDLHAGPAAPANATYAMFLDDRPNRKAGDIVVLGILSDTIEGIFSLSNRTWAFEQPAPYTYPRFKPDPAGPGLIRLNPLVQSLADEDRLAADPALAKAWTEQLATLDHAYVTAAFAWPWADASPLARMLRRSLVMPDLAGRRADAVAELSNPETEGAEILRRMTADFARIAQEDSQKPVVVLIQGHRSAPDLAAMLCPGLRARGVICFATADVQDPRDPTAFESDGHFRHIVDLRLGAEMVKLFDHFCAPTDRRNGLQRSFSSTCE